MSRAPVLSDLTSNSARAAVAPFGCTLGDGAAWVALLLRSLIANTTNTVVSEIHGRGCWLVGPFHGMFSFHTARVALAVNRGIAAVI
jgi:hypothetical protein